MDQSNIPASVQPLASGSVDEISFVNGVISNSASGSNTTAILSILGDVVSHLDVLVKEQVRLMITVLRCAYREFYVTFNVIPLLLDTYASGGVEGIWHQVEGSKVSQDGARYYTGLVG